ncbi:HEPN domain-containing protein [Pseudomonas putida]|uniref:HEPN domain-containing protein n=1 Tax=Pseudomonas putida TaxID=303 RepID=UPI000B08DC29|nr:HEPN domain-containing protein [Pseudomonas putida]
MPYSISAARKTTKLDFREIKSRIRRSQNKKVEPNIREYVIAASIFLAHATLENYISDIFSGFANGLQSSPIKGSEIPENLQAHLFLNRIDKTKIYGTAIGTHSEVESLTSITKSLKTHAGTVVDNSKTIFRFTGKDIFTNHKYPSVDNIKKVFHRIGEPKIFTRLDVVLKGNSQSLLESLGSLRTQLAHTGQIPGVSPSDVIKRIEDVEQFISAIDRVMYKLVTSFTDQKTWRSHIC